MDKWVTRKPSDSTEPDPVSETIDHSIPTENAAATSDAPPPKITKKDSTTEKRHFREEWIRTYNWLMYDEEKNKALCKTCSTCEKQNMFTFSTKKEQTFITVGFDNWKKATERFRNHEKMMCHREATSKMNSLESSVNVSFQISEHNMKQMTQACDALFAIFASIAYLAQQGLALRGHTDFESNLIHLLNLRSQDNVALKQWLQNERKFKWLSHEVQNEIICIMARYILRAVADVKFSVGKKVFCWIFHNMIN
ncbi:UNVERIFIED_CONTAM: hypothetical protein FKN15_016867 [Acipenser sinensis]